MECDAGGPRPEEDETLQEALPCHEDRDCRQQVLHLPDLAMIGKAELGLCPLSRRILLVSTNPSTWDVHARPHRRAQLTPVWSRNICGPSQLLPLSTLSICLTKGATALLNILFLYYYLCVAQKKSMWFVESDVQGRRIW